MDLEKTVISKCCICNFESEDKPVFEEHLLSCSNTIPKEELATQGDNKDYNY